VIIAIVAFLIGLSKGGLGPLVVAIILPLLSQYMPVAQAAATPLPLLLLGDVFALWVYWREWDIYYVKLLLPTAMIGVLVGTYFLERLPNDTLITILAICTLAAAIYRLLSNRLKSIAYQPRTWHGWLAGVASGFVSSIANAGAYPYTAYMLLQKEVTPRSFLGTTTLFFALVNVFKLVVQRRLIDTSQLGNILLVMPLVPLGVWLGRRFADWVNPKVFEMIMIATLIVASLFLLLWKP
jgi:uncharacterized membrane protein YfcA